MTLYGWYIGFLLVVSVVLAAMGYGPGFLIGVIIGSLIGTVAFDIPLFKEDE